MSSDTGVAFVLLTSDAPGGNGSPRTAVMTQRRAAIALCGGMPMRNIKVLITASVLALSGLLLGAAPAAAEDSGQSFRCSGGTLATPNFVNINPGTYDSITITQFCAVSLPTTGTVRDEGPLTLRGGGLFGNSPTASLIVEGNTRLTNTVFFDIGCGAGNGCTLSGNNQYRLEGNLDSRGSIDVHMHGVTIEGNLSVRGGGGGAFCFPDFHFSNIEDSQVEGNVTFSDVESCWLGIARVHVSGNLRVDNNQMADPDAIEILTNTIDGNLSCSGNQLFDTTTPSVPAALHRPWDSFESPTPTNPDARTPAPNTVGDDRRGQCVTANPGTGPF
jgi:hypothetical protein